MGNQYTYSCRRASTGSIRAARLAGYSPNISPMPMLTAHARPALQSGTADSRSSAAFITSPDAESEHDAEQPADEGEGRRLDQKLPEDLPPGGAERLAETDLRGPVGHRDHHDRHDADPADQERHARERDHREEEIGRELADHVEDLVLGDQVEGIRHPGPQIPHPAERDGREVPDRRGLDARAAGGRR